MPSLDYPDPGLAADILYAVQLCLGALFAAAAAPKLLRPGAFRATVADFAVFPRLAAVVAGLTIVGEIVVAISFLLGAWIEVGVAVAIALTSMFAAGVGINLGRGRRIDCGCFGGSEEISGTSLVRLGMMLFGALALALGFSAAGVDPVGTTRVLDAGFDGAAYVIAAAGTALGLLMSSFLVLNAGALFSALRRKETVR